MPPSSEMFRFVTLRRADRALQAQIESRLIRDRRDAPWLLGALFAPGPFEDKLEIADDVAASAVFVDENEPGMAQLDLVGRFLREHLSPGVPVADLTASFVEEFPALAVLLQQRPPVDVLEAAIAIQSRLWDSLYAQVTRGCDRYVSTNPLADGIRVYHVVLLLWLVSSLGGTTWKGHRFDEYHPVIDLQRAAEIGRGKQPGRVQTAGIAALSSPGSTPDPSFRVELERGAVRPPVVADLILVEQELRRYEMGELADVETVMRGERRERTTRRLARTSQTSTTESTSETEESSSTETDERFQLSSQAQSTAAQSFGLDVGVSVSAKYGPVQVGATVNASYDTSESSSDTTSQEYAKSVTETAARRVSNSIKQTSSVTILTETQDTALRGFNNETGTEHINGLYRWLDKVYEARLLNYGKRLMLTLNPPEPAAAYRAMLEQRGAQALAALPEPLHPSRISRGTADPLPEGNDNGVRSFHDITEDNYAEIAAVYDVTNVGPPPAYNITGSKTIVVPDGMQPQEMDEDGLSLVTAQETLTVDPDYRVSLVGVYGPPGPSGDWHQFADNLRMGEKKNETDRILVVVGHQDWHFTVTGNGNDPKGIDTNFNTQQSTSPGLLFGDKVQTSLPISISARCSGMLALTVAYSGVRRDDALDRWKAATYAAILKGYAAQRQAWLQASAAATAQVEADTVAQTFQLREDQYRAIELTELKRGCIDLLTEGSAIGRSPVTIDETDGPVVVHEATDATGLAHWRSPLSSGAVAEFFELAFDWTQVTYQFHPYYWAERSRWAETAQAAGADPVFEQFLRSGSASVNVPVRPGFERSVVFFLRTGLIWGGGYLPLFTTPDMLDVFADVELGVQLDPPVQIGEPWEVRLPTSLVTLQADDVLPEFPAEEPATEASLVQPLRIPEDAPF